MNNISFEDLNLSGQVVRAVADMGYTDPTPIQAQSIPAILAGKDVIGRSQTGSGKTAAFGLPAVELIGDDNDKTTEVLVLCPTRELAIQACDEIRKYSKYKHNVSCVPIYGGQPIDRQIMLLKKGANIVIGTPGRIMDHMRRRTLKFNNLKMIVLDEADEMLNMGFREDIETILQDMPDERQTVLFSATMPPAIMSITKHYQKDPVLVEIGSRKSAVDTIEQFYYEVPSDKKKNALLLLLKYHNPQRAIVFSNTKTMVDDLTDFLMDHGLDAQGLHGDLKQATRNQVMDKFKSGRMPILIATDVAARGIDVNDIDAVFNYDLPQNEEYYIHRIGRTARAGKKGCAYTLISGSRQLAELRDIQRQTKSELKREALPSAGDINKKNENVLFDKIQASLERVSGTNLALVDKLVAEGIELRDIAGAAITLLKEADKSSELLDMIIPDINYANTKKTGSGSGGSMANISISLGKKHNLVPGYIVSAIAKKSGVSGKCIGKIDIREENTIVGVPAADRERIIASMTGCKINGFKASVKAEDLKGTHSFNKKPVFYGDKNRNDDRAEFGKKSNKR